MLKAKIVNSNNIIKSSINPGVLTGGINYIIDNGNISGEGDNESGYISGTVSGEQGGEGGGGDEISGYTDNDPVITDIIVYSDSDITSVNQGTIQQFTAEVIGDNDPPQEVTWSIAETNKDNNSYIDLNGLLTVSENEMLTNLTIRATSINNPLKSGIFNLTIKVPTVDSVVVNPDSITLTQGDSQQFTAEVEGSYNPPQDVTWSITGGTDNTEINDGLLEIDLNQTVGNINVIATSIYNPLKSGVSVVSVEEKLIEQAPIIGDPTNRELKSLFGVSTIPQLMQKLQIRCQEGDFTGLQNGDYVDGLDLSGIDIIENDFSPQAWNDTWKNNRFEISGINHYKNETVFGTNLNGLTIGETVNTKDHIIFSFVNFIARKGYNERNTDNFGYWSSNVLKPWVDNTFTPSLEQRLGIELYPLWKYHNNKETSNWNQYKIWPMSLREIFSDDELTAAGNDYLLEKVDGSNNNSKKLYISNMFKKWKGNSGVSSSAYMWRTMLRRNNANTAAIVVNNLTGLLTTQNATSLAGFAPAFCVSYQGN